MKSDVPFMTEICLATKQQSYHGDGDNFTEKCSYTIVKIKQNHGLKKNRNTKKIIVFSWPDVPAEPDGGEVPPAQLPEDLVPVVEGVTDLDRVVAAWKQTQS